jgi:hypothetical protein
MKHFSIVSEMARRTVDIVQLLGRGCPVRDYIAQPLFQYLGPHYCFWWSVKETEMMCHFWAKEIKYLSVCLSHVFIHMQNEVGSHFWTPLHEQTWPPNCLLTGSQKIKNGQSRATPGSPGCIAIHQSRTPPSDLSTYEWRRNFTSSLH